MVPDTSLLVDVLPTSRLSESGRPLGEFRDELYKVHNLGNAFNVLGVWVQSLGVITLALASHSGWAWLAAFLLMGRAHCLFAILSHEAAHRLLFSNRRINDFVGRWVTGYPSFVPTDLYRRGHMAHHREEFGPNEPDLNLYVGYPISRASWHRKLRRDALGSTGWKNLKPLLVALKSGSTRSTALRIIAVQAALFIGITLAGYPLAYPLLWLAPQMTVWRVLNRLRAVAEHGGMQASSDRRQTTHHVRQSWIARFWMVPYNTGWHLAHHLDIGVPFQNLPRFHRELEACGYVQPGLVYPSYRAFWRAASSGPNPESASTN